MIKMAKKTKERNKAMTRQDFLNMDWNDSHVTYDMQVGSRTIAYITLSKKYSHCLCLVADNKDFPIRNSGCGISKNPCPMDVIDNKVYDLDAKTMYINGIDSEIAFKEIPFRENKEKLPLSKYLKVVDKER